VGLVLHNPSTMSRLYLNIAYVPVKNYIEEPRLRMCNSSGEISTPWRKTSGSINPFILYATQRKIENLKDLLNKIRVGDVCVYSKSIVGTPVTESGITTETKIERTSYLWNVDKILSEIYPRLYNYQANPELGIFNHCS